MLGFETTTTTMGNPASNLTVEAGAILEFFSTAPTASPNSLHSMAMA